MRLSPPSWLSFSDPHDERSRTLSIALQVGVVLLLLLLCLVDLVDKILANELNPAGIITSVVGVIFVLGLAPRSPLRKFLIPCWIWFMLMPITAWTDGSFAIVACLVLAGLAFAEGHVRRGLVVISVTLIFNTYLTRERPLAELLNTTWAFCALFAITCLPLWVAGSYFRRSRRAHESLEQAELLNGLARLDERRHLATELHDGIARDLVVINLTARSLPASALPPGTPDLEKVSADALENLAHLVTVLRQGDSVLSADSISADSRLGVIESVEHNAERLREQGLDVEVDVECAPTVHIPEPTRLLVSRALGEGTTNVLKHAPGASVTLDLMAGRGNLVLDLANTVPGSDSGLASSGVGMTALDERVELHGGRFSSGRDPEDGKWHLRLDVPLRTGAGHRAEGEAEDSPARSVSPGVGGRSADNTDA